MGRRMNGAAERNTSNRHIATELARGLPAPPARPIGDSPKLVLDEPQVFAQCEAAIETLKLAFWAAGKALQVIRDGRLYREAYPTFEAYLLDRWDMQRGYADKLIRTWRIAEAVFEQNSNTFTPIGVKKLNQAMAWELVPLAEKHSEQAAELVYRTVIEVDGVSVTAEVLKGAVKAVPPGLFDEDKTVEAVRAYLDSLQVADEGDSSLAPVKLTTEANKIRRILTRVVENRSVAGEDPAEVRQFVTELRALLDEVEQKVM